MTLLSHDGAVNALFNRYKAGYLANWQHMKIRPRVVSAVEHNANTILHYKGIYSECERLDTVPWWFHGLCHYRESNFNFDTYLGNGQSLHRRTTIVPKGRGPFSDPDAFQKGALDAMKLQGFVGATDWSIERISFRLEGFNGFGYHQHNVNSPYLYGGSTVYGPPEARGGRYVADHDFRSSVTDTQLGTMTILKQLVTLDSSIVLQPESGQQQPDDVMAFGTRWIQQTLKQHGYPKLVVDGAFGRATRIALSSFQKSQRLPSTGVPDALTIAALEDLAPVAAHLHPEVVDFIQTLSQP